VGLRRFRQPRIEAERRQSVCLSRSIHGLEQAQAAGGAVSRERRRFNRKEQENSRKNG
jgi:hypothetical protein